MPDHLYVMQASDGRIKIGRSSNPEKRRSDLEGASGLRVWVCAVFEGRGHEERRIHSECAEYRLLGEWFHNTPPAMAAIKRAVGARFRFELPAFKSMEPDEVMRRVEVEAAFAGLCADIAEEAARRPRRRTNRIASQ